MEVLYTGDLRNHGDTKSAPGETILGDWAGTAKYNPDELLQFDMAGLECRLIENCKEAGTNKDLESRDAPPKSTSSSTEDNAKKMSSLRRFRRQYKSRRQLDSTHSVGHSQKCAPDKELEFIRSKIEKDGSDLQSIEYPSDESSAGRNTQQVKKKKKKKRNLLRVSNSKRSRNLDDKSSVSNQAEFSGAKTEFYIAESQDMDDFYSDGLECRWVEIEGEEKKIEKMQKRRHLLLKAHARFVSIGRSLNEETDNNKNSTHESEIALGRGDATEGIVYPVSLIDLVECENATQSYRSYRVVDHQVELVLPESRQEEKREFSQLIIPTFPEEGEEGDDDINSCDGDQESFREGSEEKRRSEAPLHSLLQCPVCPVYQQTIEEVQSIEYPEDEYQKAQNISEDMSLSSIVDCPDDEKDKKQQNQTVSLFPPFEQGSKKEEDSKQYGRPDSKTESSREGIETKDRMVKARETVDCETSDIMRHKETVDANVQTKLKKIPYQEASQEVELLERQQSHSHRYVLAQNFTQHSLIDQNAIPLIQKRLMEVGDITDANEIQFVPDCKNRLADDTDERVTQIKTEIWQATFPSSSKRNLLGRKKRAFNKKPVYFTTAILREDRVDLEKLQSAFLATSLRSSNSLATTKSPPMIFKVPDTLAEGLTGYKAESMSPICHTINSKLFIDESIIDFPTEMDGTCKIHIGSGMTGKCVSISMAKFLAVANKNPSGVEFPSFVEDNTDVAGDDETESDDDILSESLGSLSYSEDSIWGHGEFGEKLDKDDVDQLRSQSIIMASIEREGAEMSRPPSQVRISVSTVDATHFPC